MRYVCKSTFGYENLSSELVYYTNAVLAYIPSLSVLLAYARLSLFTAMISSKVNDKIDLYFLGLFSAKMEMVLFFKCIYFSHKFTTCC